MSINIIIIQLIMVFLEFLFLICFTIINKKQLLWAILLSIVVGYIISFTMSDTVSFVTYGLYFVWIHAFILITSLFLLYFFQTNTINKKHRLRLIISFFLVLFLIIIVAYHWRYFKIQSTDTPRQVELNKIPEGN